MGVNFPSCLMPSLTNGRHVFADVSINAYGAVAYPLWPTPDVSANVSVMLLL